MGHLPQNKVFFITVVFRRLFAALTCLQKLQPWSGVSTAKCLKLWACNMAQTPYEQPPTCSVTSCIHFHQELACRHSEVRPVVCGSGRHITFTSRCQWQRAVSLFCRPGKFESARYHMHARQKEKRKRRRRTNREAEAERKSPLQRKIMHENKQLQPKSDRDR